MDGTGTDEPRALALDRANNTILIGFTASKIWTRGNPLLVLGQDPDYQGATNAFIDRADPQLALSFAKYSPTAILSSRRGSFGSACPSYCHSSSDGSAIPVPQFARTTIQLLGVPQ